ncbi:MAG: hypothetical protein JEZ00_19560 [Anaerolineaceae bacterium]|nr:hypothetical protein [Anaerolineaceae bacterium]
MRQLVDEEGAVTLSVSYTPWGDTMEIYGSGMLNLGYLGGVYDPETGLIYMGNGQYYDPSTGRFLTRGVNGNQMNPYTPWNTDPAGMLLAPIALIFMMFGKKKKKNKIEEIVHYTFLIITLICVVLLLGMYVTQPAFADEGINPYWYPRTSGNYDSDEVCPDWLPECQETTVEEEPISPVAVEHLLARGYSSTTIENESPYPEIYPTPEKEFQINSCVEKIWDVPLSPDYVFTRQYYYSPLGRWYTPTARGMKKLYEKYIEQEKADNFEEFFGQIISREISSLYTLQPLAASYIMQGTSVQLWSGIKKNKNDVAYEFCQNGPDRCVNGAINWLARYPQSGIMQYGTAIFAGNDVNIKDIPTKWDPDHLYSTAQLVEMGRQRARIIGWRVLWDKSLRPYSGDVPIDWGAPPAQGSWFYEVFSSSYKNNTPDIGTEDYQMLYYNKSGREGIYSQDQYDYWSWYASYYHSLTDKDVYAIWRAQGLLVSE